MEKGLAATNVCVMDKFQNKYRIPSARLQSWDFFTLCTQNMAQPLLRSVSLPLHTRTILIIDKTDGDVTGNGNMHCGMGNNVETLQCNVSTLLPNGPIFPKNEKMAKISPKSGTLSTIIRSRTDDTPQRLCALSLKNYNFNENNG